MMRRDKGTALLLSAVVVGMIGLTYAAVPLYQLFCQVTGYGGTTQVAEVVPEAVSDRVIEVRFNADVNSRLPWSFQPVQRVLRLRVGEVAIAAYRAENLGTRSIKGTAVFNVTPLKAGEYFNKVQCFCFDEQELAPGEVVDMPVTFFVDPAIEEDPRLDDVRTITLSYTFFRSLDDTAAGEARDGAVQKASLQ